MYSSCIMSEEVWKQEQVHVFLLYNVRKSVETGVCTCIPPQSCIMSEEVWKREYVHVCIPPV
jgi:hypothetical protein